MPKKYQIVPFKYMCFCMQIKLIKVFLGKEVQWKNKEV